MFIVAVLKSKVVDVAFQPAIKGDLKSTPPIAAEKEVAEKSHEAIAKVFHVRHEDAVKKDLAEKVPLLDYYEVVFDKSLKPSLVKLTV